MSYKEKAVMLKEGKNVGMQTGQVQRSQQTPFCCLATLPKHAKGPWQIKYSWNYQWLLIKNSFLHFNTKIN